MRSQWIVAFGIGWLAILSGVAARAADESNWCGGIGGVGCANGMVCDYGPATCHIADNAGHCVAMPSTCPSEQKPVCGCDHRTYANDCERLKKHVWKDHDGACPKLESANQPRDGRSHRVVCVGKYFKRVYTYHPDDAGDANVAKCTSDTITDVDGREISTGVNEQTWRDCDEAIEIALRKKNVCTGLRSGR